jgi:hypothetical protein
MLNNIDVKSPAVSVAPLTPAQLWSRRAQQALVAEACAERCVRALENRRQDAAGRWNRHYRRAAAACRALGELLRAGGADSDVRR